MTVTSDISDSRQELAEFAEKVFNYALQKFGIIYKEHASSSLFTEEIGDAVVILQLHMRDFLRDSLCRCFEKMNGVIDTSQRVQALRHLLDMRTNQPMEKHPIHTILLGYLALITEIIIFMDSAGLPVRRDWFTQIWTCIYETKLKEKFDDQWEELKDEAAKICAKCPYKNDLFAELKLVEHPYVEIDPSIVTFQDLDPFFMYFAITGTGFEYPRQPGLATEVIEKLKREHIILV